MTDASEAFHRLDRYGTIIVSGADAHAFLQGQLSFDLHRLTRDRIELAALSSAQGRVQAVLWLIERQDGVVLLLPTALVDSTLARLRKYVLRAKVKLESGSGRLGVFGSNAASIGAARTHLESAGVSRIQWPGSASRVLTIAPPNASADDDARFSLAWARDDIAAGLPVVHPETHEAFVAQMLNIDLLDGISFEKGCYTGQEIIARMHFRGSVKRRMLRFRASTDAPPPATRIVAGEQHAGDVVDSAVTSDGCELLAVVNLANENDALSISEAPGPALTRLPLPYPL